MSERGEVFAEMLMFGTDKVCVFLHTSCQIKPKLNYYAEQMLIMQRAHAHRGEAVISDVT